MNKRNQTDTVRLGFSETFGHKCHTISYFCLWTKIPKQKKSLLNHFKVRVRSPRLRVSNAYLQELIPQCRSSSETLCIGCGWDAVGKNVASNVRVSLPFSSAVVCLLRDSVSDQDTRAMKGFPARMPWQPALGLLISSAAWYVSCVGIRWVYLVCSAFCHCWTCAMSCLCFQPPTIHS